MTVYLRDTPIITEDIEYLLTHDAMMQNFDVKKDDIIWEAFDEGFSGMVRILQGQQISFKGANTLWLKLSEDVDVTNPKALRDLSVDALKSYGFSKQKQNYLSCLIEAVQERSICFSDFVDMPNEDIIKSISNVKGFGQWSAQAYLTFCLHRGNVALQNDLVVDKALMKLFGYKDRPDVQEVKELLFRWRPRQTAAILILWYLQIYRF